MMWYNRRMRDYIMAVSFCFIYKLYFILVCTLSSFASCVSMTTSHQEENPLKGKHLRVLAMEFPNSIKVNKRNETGHIIEIEGVLKDLIDTLSEMLNFSFSYLPDSVRVFDDSPFARGAISYLYNDEVDYVLSTTIGTSARYKYVDYPSYWYFGPFGIIVPYPKETFNIGASFKPFSSDVWITIISSVFAILIFLRFLSFFSFHKYSEIHINNLQEQKRINMTRIAQYVIGNFFSQGHMCYSKHLTVRFAAGAWCLGCFFIVQMYSCTLTSHLMSPNQKPIVNSFFGIADTPGVKLTVDRGFGVDVLLQQSSVFDGRIKKLAEMMRMDPSLRCNVTADCLQKVRAGYCAYSAPHVTLQTIVYADLKNTSTCNYFLIKEGFWSSPVFTALRKNSPYTEAISRGILRIRSVGLFYEWDNRYIRSPSKCMTLNQRGKKPPRLSIGHLSSAFVILFAGYALSLLVFLIENIVASLFHCVHRN